MFNGIFWSEWSAGPEAAPHGAQERASRWGDQGVHLGGESGHRFKGQSGGQQHAGMQHHRVSNGPLSGTPPTSPLPYPLMRTLSPTNDILLRCQKSGRSFFFPLVTPTFFSLLLLLLSAQQNRRQHRMHHAAAHSAARRPGVGLHAVRRPAVPGRRDHDLVLLREEPSHQRHPPQEELPQVCRSRAQRDRGELKRQ